jgi:hypothetical protein
VKNVQNNLRVQERPAWDRNEDTESGRLTGPSVKRGENVT